MTRHSKPANPFRWFDSSSEVIQMAVMLYVRFPLSLRNVEYLTFEQGMDICHETVRLWVNRCGRLFASKIRSRAIQAMRLQKFASTHASFHNHFNQELHLVSRQEHRTRRSAILTGWKFLVA